MPAALGDVFRCALGPLDEAFRKVGVGEMPSTSELLKRRERGRQRTGVGEEALGVELGPRRRALAVLDGVKGVGWLGQPEGAGGGLRHEIAVARSGIEEPLAVGTAHQLRERSRCAARGP